MSETILTHLEQEAASSALQTPHSSKNEGDFQNHRVMGKGQILSALSACPLEGEGSNPDSDGTNPILAVADKTLEANKACPLNLNPHVFEWNEDKAGAVNLEQASAFLSLFVWPSEEVWVQTFQDGPTSLYLEDTFKRKDGSSGSKLKYKISKDGKTIRSDVTTWGSVKLEEFQSGTKFAQAATRDSLARVGMFSAVNTLEPGAENRSADRVKRIRAVFTDLDGAPLPPCYALPPTAIVESSPGRFHVYWAVSDVPLENFTPIQKYLAQLYGGDPVVCDLARVMRLPGFWHGKKEPGFLSHVLEQNPGAQYTRANLVGAFEGLEAALEQAQQQTKARLEAAELSRERALELREELKSADLSDRAAVLAKYAQAAKWDEVGKVSSAFQGGRNDQLFKSAAALGTLVGAGILERGEASLELEAAALAVGLDEREVRSTLENGLRAGEKTPRDLSNVAQLVGQKKGKKAKVGKLSRATQEGDAGGKTLDTKGGSSRPAVDLPFDHFDTAQVLFSALQSTNDPPHLFWNDDGLCRLESGRLGRMVRVLGAKELKGHIGRRFTLTKTSYDEAGEAIVKDHNLSDKEALFMLGLELDTYSPFPFLGGILRTPVYNARGVLETREGYSKALEMFLDLGGRAVPEVPETPTPEDVSEARALLLDELLCDFPFTDDASRAHAVALGLQPLARALIGGPTPLYGIEAPVRGTGKTLLATLMGYIVTGQEVGVIAAPTGGSKDSDEEWRKTIVAELGNSPTVVLFDNANEIDSKTLASSITALTVKARILGYSKMFTARNVFTWVFTANNPQLSSEIARRTVTIRLESPFEEPELREGFKHPNLTQWVRENRERLLWALLVLIQNWLSLGRPLCSKTLGSFEDWVGVMGGILEAAEIPGFLDNIKTASRMTTNDAAQWRDFTAAWWEHFTDAPLVSSALLELAQTGDYLGHILNAKGKDGKERSGRSLQTTFGLELKRRAETVGGGRIIGRFKLTYGGTDSHTGVALYRLLELSETRESAGGAQGTARYGKTGNTDSETASSVAVPLNQGTAKVQQRYGNTEHDLSSPSDPALEVQQRYGIGTATGTASLEPSLNGVSRDMPYLAVPKTPQDENKNSDLAKDDDAGYL